MSQLPLDTSIQVEYSDGFILDETELDDISPYNKGQNVLRAVLDKQPEAEHGAMVRFSVFYKDQRHDINWATLPANARPIRFRDGQKTMNTGTGEVSFCWTGCRFGYQFNDATGRNVQEVVEL